MEPGYGMRKANDHSAIFAGAAPPTEGLKMMLIATWIGSPRIPKDGFAAAVAADTCVADEPAADELKNGRYGGALEGRFSVAAYLKLVKTPPLDASCMSNQLKFLSPYLDARWDAPGQCANKIPRLVQHK